jgi:cytochrome c oxidase accessory protein FixG
MFDRDSLLISYRAWRGEPNGPHKAGESWEGRGDCIDCRQCVAVCPTGIDIRDGAQLECIQCALCIDACDEIMDKVGRPRGLIAYDTLQNLEAGAENAQPLRLWRPRVLLYAGAIVLVSLIMLVALLTRSDFGVSVLHDRNPLFVRLSDGGVRNGYEVKLLNKQYMPRDFKVEVTGLPGSTVRMVGHENGIVVVPPDQLQSVKLYVALDKEGVSALPAQATPFQLVVTDTETGVATRRDLTFQGPPKQEAK